MCRCTQCPKNDQTVLYVGQNRKQNLPPMTLYAWGNRMTGWIPRNPWMKTWAAHMTNQRRFTRASCMARNEGHFGTSWIATTSYLYLGWSVTIVTFFYAGAVLCTCLTTWWGRGFIWWGSICFCFCWNSVMKLRSTRSIKVRMKRYTVSAYATKQLISSTQVV